MIGKTLAHYEISEQIGAGGMGEVFRARDGKLGRDVALKILPEAFAKDPERMARFQREAQVLAQLNHANIAAIYGLETAGDSSALVLELVEGPTLADRIRSGAIRVNEMVGIARQIAEAIESAHESGIIHRDLKPANVKLTPEGNVKVLDFGLAKAFEDNPTQTSGAALDSPTISPAYTSPVITGALTGANVILGTAAYMSPEQARGQAVDKRSDIWAFGVVCFEMLTGRRLFEGETVSDTLAAVLKTEPDWDSLPPATPASLRRLLQRCLERDPRKRLRDIGEARFRLEEWSRDPASLEMRAPVVAASRPARIPVIPWVVAAIAAAAAVFSWIAQPDPVRPPKIRLAVQLPHQAELSTNSGVNIQQSPDGQLLAYRTREGIRLRRLDQVGTTLLKDTGDVLQFTFSPDGKWIAFVARGTLRRVSVDGGAPVDICDADLVARGIAWLDPGTIVFTPGFIGGMQVVSLETGEIRDVTAVDAEAGERSHRWPTPLPDGKSVLFLCQYHGQDYDDGEIRIITVGEESATTVYRGGAAPRYSPSGHLLFAKDNTVFAVPLDLETRETRGLPVPVLGEVWARVNDQESDDGSAQFDLSPQGTLIYQTQPGGVSARIVAADVATRVTRAVTEPGPISGVLASPDGRHVAYRHGAGIHLVDLESGGSSQFTFSGTRVRLGAWTPDSRTLFWNHLESDTTRVLSRPIDGTEPPTTISSRGNFSRPTSISPSGEWLLLTEWFEDRGGDEWGILLQSLTDPGSEPRILIDGPNTQSAATFSPDGEWICYRSNDAGAWGLYLRQFPDTGARWLLTGGAEFAHHEWLADGSGILIHDGDGTFRVPIDFRTGSPKIGDRVPLLPMSVVPSSEATGQATFSPDGSTVYFIQREGRGEDEESAVVLVTDWLSELEELAPR